MVAAAPNQKAVTLVYAEIGRRVIANATKQQPIPGLGVPEVSHFEDDSCQREVGQVAVTPA
jgi:hypothetical protein